MEDPLAEEILLGKFVANDTVVVDVDENGQIVFRKGAPLGLEGDFGHVLEGEFRAVEELPTTSLKELPAPEEGAAAE